MSETPLVERTEIHHDDYLTEFRVFSHWIEFTVFEIGMGSDGAGGFTVPHFHRKGAADSGDMTTDRAEAEPYVRGTIKWDGCSHVYFGDEDGYLHLCGRRSFDDLRALLDRAWAVAASEMPQFDADTAA
jgi:hypothetical protein